MRNKISDSAEFEAEKQEIIYVTCGNPSLHQYKIQLCPCSLLFCAARASVLSSRTVWLLPF